jgi:hypothetical protein
MDYELVLASETFDDDNDGYEYGINWLDDMDGEEDSYVCECQWFKTEEERQEALDRWYANQDKFNPEQ